MMSLASSSVWKSKFDGMFVLNYRVVLHAIDATPAQWRGDAGSSPIDGASTATSSPRNDLVKNSRVHPTHWLISKQVPVQRAYVYCVKTAGGVYATAAETALRRSLDDVGQPAPQPSPSDVVVGKEPI